jgi:glutamyl-tRNA synthetase
MAPYLLVEPDLSSEEARVMLKLISADDYSMFGNCDAFNHLFEYLDQTLRTVRTLLLNETDLWQCVNIDGILRQSNKTVGLPHKVFMTILRHALCGMKVSSFFCAMKISFSF